MSTPTWVRFSTVDRPAGQLLDDLAPLLRRLEFDLYKVSRLGWDPYEEAFGYAGDQGQGSKVACTTEADALAIADGWDGFCLSYNALSVWTPVYLYFWKAERGMNLAVDITAPALFFESDDYRPGEWLLAFLTEYTATVGADVCGYGTPYTVVYEPLLPQTVLAGLGTGELLRAKAPVLHLVSFRIAGPDEIAPLLTAQPIDPRLTYRRTTSGYHVLADLS